MRSGIEQAQRKTPTNRFSEPQAAGPAAGPWKFRERLAEELPRGW